MEEIPLVLEVAHRISDGSRRNAEIEPLCQRSTPGRLRRIHVRTDHGLEHLSLAIREILTYGLETIWIHS